MFAGTSSMLPELLVRYRNIAHRERYVTETWPTCPTLLLRRLVLHLAYKILRVLEFVNNLTGIARWPLLRVRERGMCPKLTPPPPPQTTWITFLQRTSIISMPKLSWLYVDYECQILKYRKWCKPIYERPIEDTLHHLNRFPSTPTKMCENILYTPTYKE